MLSVCPFQITLLPSADSREAYVDKFKVMGIATLSATDFSQIGNFKDVIDGVGHLVG